ncbi:MAG TPA: hypothetical protein VHG90_05820, partial [Acidimicrobiales bacterium]|nr:hypothetical protein [Acidimicrobiales bacterium]
RIAVFHLTPLVAAGGCGAAVLAAAVVDDEAGSRRALAGSAAALLLVCLGLAGGRQGVQVVVLVGGLALAAVLTVDAAPPEERAAPALLALLGTAGALVGAGALLVGDDRWDLPETGVVSRAAVAVLVGSAALWAVAGTVRSRRPPALLLPGGLVLGLAAAPLRPGADDVALMAAVLAAAAVVAAATAPPPMALGLLALAAGCASPGLTPASRLLAAAAVLIAAADRPLALLAALPAGVALAGGVVDDGGWPATVVAVAGVAVGALLTRRAVGEAGASAPRPVTPGLVPAVAAVTWLVLLPGSWTWTGAELGHYDRGMARGAVAAGVVVAAATVGPRLALRTGPRLGRRPGGRWPR